MRVLPQALEIIFEVQRKGVLKKQEEEKKTFQLTKLVFFFPSLWTSSTFKLHNYFISYSC
jgi:hypothetical protein